MDFVTNFYKRILISLTSFVVINAHADTCAEWFQDSKINSGEPNCLSKCNTFEVDMSTYSCHSNCENFCKPKKCPPGLNWKSKIHTGRPTDWDYKTEVTLPWSKSEIEILENIFKILPDSLEKINFDGFYRMEKSVDRVNPATTSLRKSIALYDNTFKHSAFKADRVVTHELAHIIYLNYSKSEVQDYLRTMGWEVKGGTYQRKGAFLISNIQESPEEDFAVNIEYFLFENANVRKNLPEAYKWIQIKYPKYFKLKEVCNDK